MSDIFDQMMGEDWKSKLDFTDVTITNMNIPTHIICNGFSMYDVIFDILGKYPELVGKYGVQCHITESIENAFKEKLGLVQGKV